MEPHDCSTGGRPDVKRTEPHDEADRKERRDTEYHRRILSAAQRLFEQNGIDSVNMYQIAQEAGIGQGTLYRRYSHLGEICSHLLLDSTEHFLDELETHDARVSSPVPALDRLKEVIVRLVNYIDDKAELLSTISCMYAGKKSFLPIARPITVRLQQLIAGLLDRACKQGEANDVDVTLVSNCLLASLAPEQYLYHRDKLGYSKDRYVAGINRLFIEGLQER